MYQPAQPISYWAVEQATAIFTAAVTDENGSGTVGSSAVFTLSDGIGNIVNARQNVSIPGSGSSFTIILSGLDLKRLPSESDPTVPVVRCLEVKCQYNSPTSGTSQPQVGIYWFGITPTPVET